MKCIKILLMLIVVILLVQSNVCFAETNLSLFLESFWAINTEMCNVAGLEMDPLIAIGEVEVRESTNEFYVTGYPGIMFVRRDDLRLNKIWFAFYNLNASSDEAVLRDLVDIISVICALEYDIPAMYLDAMRNRTELNYEMIYTEALAIYRNDMMPIFIDNFDTVLNDENVVIYEGKYRYTAYERQNLTDSEFIYVMAEVIE